ncbi:beta-ketoacyl synthase chain length factor [Methylovulum sp.]|uniref:beta-ketoacyl synthase chain length factor n=1 Tax=Methylovulum sp. TaxID=1916980 RepID=UPI00262EE447|nr:beta-ketoacyl synthase chain length factor [Methylovulum sp.]
MLNDKPTHWDFVLKTWAVWPPLTAPSDLELEALQKNRLAFIPHHLKRRLSPLAKTVFCAAGQCDSLKDNLKDTLKNNWPVVFSSTHGELGKSLEMIKLIEAGEEISPTAFSLSVHNAIAGLFSIVYGNTAEMTVLASGEDGIGPAFLEALGLLQEGAADVLIVFYDEPLPDFYPAAPFQLSTDSRCALMLAISKDGDGQTIQFQRDGQCGYAGEQPVQLPLLIQFLSGADTRLQIKTPRQTWHWQKLESLVETAETA